MAIASPDVVQPSPQAVIPQPLRVICPLHGIRTQAVWQKGLADLASSRGWACRLDRWSYGRFSLLAFLTPWTREAKLNWLRRQYDAEIHDRRLNIEQGQSPSVVAHSFGTYILGFTLLRFDFIRFNKVILCGSILPRDFPWDKLIERGQVQAVRNEYGVRDPWVKRVRCFVRGTGPSGASGFTCQHERLEQEELEYDHSDYFGIDHMEDRWIPFLNKPLEEIPRAKDGPRIPRPQASVPLCLYGSVIIGMLLIISLAIACACLKPGNGDPALKSMESALFLVATLNPDDSSSVKALSTRFVGQPVKWSGIVRNVDRSKGEIWVRPLDYRKLALPGLKQEETYLVLKVKPGNIPKEIHGEKDDPQQTVFEDLRYQLTFSGVISTIMPKRKSGYIVLEKVTLPPHLDPISYSAPSDHSFEKVLTSIIQKNVETNDFEKTKSWFKEQYIYPKPKRVKWCGTYKRHEKDKYVTIVPLSNKLPSTYCRFYFNDPEPLKNHGTILQIEGTIADIEKTVSLTSGGIVILRNSRVLDYDGCTPTVVGEAAQK